MRRCFWEVVWTILFSLKINTEWFCIFIWFSLKINTEWFSIFIWFSLKINIRWLASLFGFHWNQHRMVWLLYLVFIENQHRMVSLFYLVFVKNQHGMILLLYFRRKDDFLGILRRIGGETHFPVMCPFINFYYVTIQIICWSMNIWHNRENGSVNREKSTLRRDSIK